VETSTGFGASSVAAEDVPLAEASALNGIEFNLARAVGPALAGLLISAAGVAAALVALVALNRFLVRRSAIERGGYGPDPGRDLVLIAITSAGGLAVMAYLVMVR